MKRYLSIVALTLLLYAALSCEEHNPVLPPFSIDRDELVLGCEGGTEKLTVISDREWTAISSEPWVMVSPANGIGESIVRISVDTTLVKDLRSAVVSFSVDGEMNGKINVSQTGYANIISVSEPELTLEHYKKGSERKLTAKIISNLSFKAEIEGNPEWISVDSFESGSDPRNSRPRSSTVTFSWKINPMAEERVAKINFLPLDESLVIDQPAVLTVTQKAAPLITDDRAGDSLAVVLINNILGTMSTDDFSENMLNWSNVALWDVLDKDLPCREAIGRIRAARFYMFATDESVPHEISNLKYLQTLELYSNANNYSKSIDLGSDICSLDYLEYLQIGAYGLVSLPEDFVRLGKSLKALDLNSNNFSDIPALLTPENFPKLKTLRFNANIRRSITDLRKASEFDYSGGLGLHIHTGESTSLSRLLLWENLEELSLSYNCIEGSLPDFKPGENGVKAWSDADVKAFGGDTIQFLATKNIAKILPNASVIRLNLNFFTGNLPDWLLYHPRLLDMDPQTLVFYQREFGRNSKGEIVKFDNEPGNFEYYFEAFPKFREKYTFNDVYED